MIHFWNRGIPTLLGWALLATAIGPTRHTLDAWVIHGNIVAGLYILYAVVLFALAIAPLRLVGLHLIATALAVPLAIGSTVGSVLTLLEAGGQSFWSISGAVTGSLLIWGLLISWHWLMARFWTVLFKHKGLV